MKAAFRGVQVHAVLTGAQNASARHVRCPLSLRDAGFSTFAREGDTMYQCYSSGARGAEFGMGYHPIPSVDRTLACAPPRVIGRVLPAGRCAGHLAPRRFET
jgi:hypothetical protein